MTTNTAVILLEFNELTPRLLDRFMAAGQLPNFKRFHDESQVFITDAEESGERLNPWVQWVTVHSGMSYADHGVLRLNEGHKLTKPCLWDILSQAGKRVLVCGSMNVRYDRPLNGYVVPDAWSVATEPYPPDAGLEDYFRFVKTQVQEHTNESVPLSAGDYTRFLKFMVGHGLSPHTVTSIVKQLAGERVGAAGRWKRAVILDKLQFDLFRALYERNRPHFATFFLNSTAHMQHSYWRHMDPEPFQVKPSEQETDEFGDAVLFGYREMDDILGRFMTLAGRDVTLVFTTGLGQQPHLEHEETGGKRFYRPKNFEHLMSFAGVPAEAEVSPVMSEEFHVDLPNEALADSAERAIRALKANGRPLMKVARKGSTGVFAGVGIFDEIPSDALLTNEAGKSVPLFDVFYQAETLKSGRHHPDGAFWIRTPARTRTSTGERVSLRAVAPTILALFEMEPPPYMKAEPVALGAQKVGV